MLKLTFHTSGSYIIFPTVVLFILAINAFRCYWILIECLDTFVFNGWRTLLRELTITHKTCHTINSLIVPLTNKTQHFELNLDYYSVTVTSFSAIDLRFNHFDMCSFSFPICIFWIICFHLFTTKPNTTWRNRG